MIGITQSNGASMNLNQLRIFQSAAKLLNFTRAAEELHLTQPGISKHLKALEEYYGARLFERLGKKVVLTQAGEALHEATSAAFNLLDAAKARIDDINGLAGGKLVIGASVTIGTYILPGKLVRFRQHHPGVEIKVETALSRQITDKVLDNSLELGLVGHYARDARLEAKSFMDDRLALIVSPRHPWAKRKSVLHLKELSNQTLLVSKRGSGTYRIVEALLAKEGVRPAGVMELGTTEAVKQAVAADLGVSLLSRHVLELHLASGAITAVKFAGGEPSRELYFVYHKDRYLSPAARAFVEMLLQED
jgi:DNA-binding transcriptional LysR family regulator